MCLSLSSHAEKAYARPQRYERDIQAFEETDREFATPSGAIVCTGSSSIRMWHATISDDLSPLTLILRGFGGSTMNDVLHYAHRIVTPYRPRAVVLYEGDNDIAAGISPERVASTFRRFVETVHEELPETRIYFLSIKPSLSRWHLWPLMKEANGYIANLCLDDRRLTYVDIASGMLDDRGNPRPELFLKDRLHMNRQGYAHWRDVLRPVLMDRERVHEEADHPPDVEMLNPR